ncbi:MAG TPA: hypothetical protein VLF79_02640 [Candidatus Saccharimonadales bacterium]|nr:hypothetical protein [Candidatus Saccharimonadales bacterium]
MTAEIYHCLISDDEPKRINAQVIEDGALYWISDFGDGLGNEAFVLASGDYISLFIGKIIVESEGEFRFKVLSDVKKLKAGESFGQSIFNKNDEELLLHVRNSGPTRTDPHLN